jgi:hypothetical protein
MKRPILILVAGCVFLTMTSCSLPLFNLPTPFPTTPFVLPTPSGLPSPTSAVPSPVPATPTLALPSPTTAPATAAAPTATTGPSPAPSATPPASLTGPFAVILVGTGDVLNIRSGPGPANALVGTFPPAATNVMRTGPATTSGSELWVQVQNPGGGTGWVNTGYLTEYVPSATFCADSRVNTLLANLRHALTASDGAQLASLVSPVHGTDVRLYRYGTLVNYDAAHAQYVFSSTYEVGWGPAPGSGQETKGSFHVSVLPGLQEVFNASYTLSCNTVQTGGASYDTSWPAQYKNINFYSVYKPGPGGQELNWRTVLVGVEYAGGQPYVFSLTQMTWEP